MKLSVAMCTYNGASFLWEQLNSIAAQELLPDELVICDDCSTDSTTEIIKEFAGVVPFTVWLHLNEQNLGPSKNFAQAISLCEGDTIALADQDDVWMPEKLRRIVAEFAAQPQAGMIFSDAEVVDTVLQPLGYRAWESSWVEFREREQELCRDGRALEVLLTRNIVTGSTLAFSSNLKELILPIPDLNGVLHDYWIAAIVAAASIPGWIDEPLVKYRQHHGQVIGLLPPGKRDAPLLEPGEFRRSTEVQEQLVEALHQRLSERNQSGEYNQVISKLEHFQFRTRIRNQSFGSRLVLTFKELRSGRYHSFSKGFRSAAGDISLPHKLLQLETGIRKSRP